MKGGFNVDLNLELTRVSNQLRKMAQETGEMLTIREAAKTDDEFLDALAVATNTSRDMIDFIAMAMLLPIGDNWVPGHPSNESYRKV